MHRPEEHQPQAEGSSQAGDRDAVPGPRHRSGAGTERRHEHDRRHRQAGRGTESLAAGARRRVRGLPWRILSRVVGIALFALAAWFAPRGLLLAALVLALGLGIERLIRRPVALERDRSRRHLRRNIGVAMTTAAGILLYSFAIGDPTAHLRPPAIDAEAFAEQDESARRIAALAGGTALGGLALSLLLFGFDRSADRHARRRRARRRGDATAPA